MAFIPLFHSLVGQVDRIEDNTKNSHKEALTLVETVGLALKSDKKFHWDTPFLNIIHSILTKHPVSHFALDG